MDAVVIGTGPYGLAVAANLLRKGFSVRVFGRPMEMWIKHMPQGMTMKSDGFATNIGALPLSLGQFCKATQRPYMPVGYRVPIADLIAYGMAVREQYIPDISSARVTQILPRRGGFLVKTAEGEEVAAKSTGPYKVRFTASKLVVNLTFASQTPGYFASVLRQ